MLIGIGYISFERIKFRIGVFSVTEGKLSNSVLIGISFDYSIAFLILDTETDTGKRLAICNVGFCQFEFSNDRLVCEANASLIFDRNGFTIVANFEIMIGIVLYETYRGSFFIQEVTTKTDTFSQINTKLGFAKSDHEGINFCVKFTVVVGVSIDMEYSSGQFILGIFLVHFGGSNITLDRMIGKSNAGLVSYDNGFSVISDFEIVIAIILEEAFGSNLFVQEVTVIAEVIHCIDTVFAFGHFTYKQVDLCIEFLIAIHIHEDFEDGAAERILGILLIDLGGLDCTGNEFIFDSNLHDLLMLGNGNRIAVFIQYESRCCLDLAHDPSAERYILKVEDTNLIGLAGKNCGFLRKLSFVLRK